jgi:hypothetical protein
VENRPYLLVTNTILDDLYIYPKVGAFEPKGAINHTS